MKIAIITNIAPLYRCLLWQKLSQSSDHEYTFFSSKEKLNGIECIDPLLFKTPVSNGGIRWESIRNIVFLNRVIWQRGVIRLSLFANYDVFIFSDEMQILSTWLMILICKLRRKKIAFWGHGIYGNEGKVKKIIRLTFNNLPDAHLLYNERAKNILLKYNIKAQSLFIVFNSLNYDLHKQLRKSISENELKELRENLFPKSSEDPVIIFIGRLTHEKKIDQLLKSIGQLHKMGHSINCLIIGEGEAISELKDLTRILQLTDYVVFYGSCYNERENALMISLATCCVSPGNVGLTAVHSMTFGTPVISHNLLSYQGPEVSCIIENKTGELFEKDNIEDLTKKIKKIVFIKGKDQYLGNCLSLIDNYYTPDYQVNVFNDLINYLERV